MKLIYSNGSPFARKVRIMLAEKAIAFESMVVDDYTGEALVAANPIGQVPALVRDDGSSLYDSGVICAWLDTLPGGPRFIPDGEAQWAVRRAEAAADSVMENVIKIRVEAMRPDDKQWPELVARIMAKTAKGLDGLEALGPGEGLDLAEATIVCALEYIDFRTPQLDWRQGRPNLLARWERQRMRPSFADTRPF